MSKHLFMRNTIAATVVGLWVSLSAVEAKAVAPGGVDLSVSMLSYQMNRLSDDPSGDTGTTGTTFYHLGAQVHLPVSRKFLFSPVLRYMPDSVHASEAPDGASKASAVLLGLPFTMIIDSNAYAGGGFGVLRYTVKGKGGSKEMPNGNSTTEFQLPGRTVTSTTIYGSLEGGYIAGRTSIGAELLLQGLMSSTKRTFSGLLSVGYQVGSI